MRRNLFTWQTEILHDHVFISKLLSLALPITLQSLMLALVAAADAFMLGHVEQNAMAAVSLASQVQFIQNCILITLVSAVSILGSQYWGKQDRKTVNEVFCVELILAAAVSLLFFVGCVFYPRVLMHLYTNEEVLIELGAQYLRIAGISYLLTGFSQSFLVLMKITDHASETARISTFTVLLNIFLNAVLIFGWFGMPAMGIQGAALATLTARIIELIWSFTCGFRKDYFTPDFRYIFKGRRIIWKDYIICMIPLLGASLLWSVGFSAYSAFMGHLGTDAAAANSVASVVRDLVCCMCNGLGAGASILLGNELGAGQLNTARKYGNQLVYIAFICGAFSTLLMLITTPVLMHFVKLTSQASSYLRGMMMIMAFYMIGRAVNTVIVNGIFASGGDTMFDVYSLTVTMWCLAVPLAAAGTFLFHWPALVVYALTCLDEVGKIPWVLFHYRKYKWVRNLTHE